MNYRGVKVHINFIPARREYWPVMSQKEPSIYYSVDWPESPFFNFYYDMKRYIDYKLDCPLGSLFNGYLKSNDDDQSLSQPIQLQLTLDF